LLPQLDNPSRPKTTGPSWRAGEQPIPTPAQLDTSQKLDIHDVVRRVFDEIITWSQAGFRQLELFASLGVPGRENLAL